MTANNPITEILGAPLAPDWTVEGLADQLLGTIAARPSDDSGGFAVSAADTADRQTRRLLRPLLAHLATRSAAEAGTPVNLYGGDLSFRLRSPTGPVWVLGHFDNRPDRVCVSLRRSDSPAAVLC